MTNAPYRNILFTGAVATRIGNLIEVKHKEINITIDPSSDPFSSLSKWNDKKMNCDIITPIID